MVATERKVTLPRYVTLIEPGKPMRDCQRLMKGFRVAKIALDLMPLDQLRGLISAHDVPYPGVYFLWYRAELLYVGLSGHVSNRVYAHELARDGRLNAKRIPFDRSTALRLREGLTLKTETAYIRAYRPPFNDKFL